MFNEIIFYNQFSYIHIFTQQTFSGAPNPFWYLLSEDEKFPRGQGASDDKYKNMLEDEGNDANEANDITESDSDHNGDDDNVHYEL